MKTISAACLKWKTCLDDIYKIGNYYSRPNVKIYCASTWYTLQTNCWTSKTLTSDKNVHLQYHAMLFATFLWDHAYAHVCVNAYWLIWIYN